MILSLNGGSSSIKFALFRPERPVGLESRILSGALRRIGLKGGALEAADAEGAPLISRALDIPDHPAALQALIDWLQEAGWADRLTAAAHRIVHGGRNLRAPVRLTPAILEELKTLVPLAPNHLPQEIAAIEAVRVRFPDLVQVLCFDTAFHCDLPDVARLFALPRNLAGEGLVRYGFHGLSYEYLLRALERRAGPGLAHGRLILAHLGNGASLAAVRGGRSLDTTMGFTPTGGIAMGTRSGDLDPGILFYRLRRGCSVDDLDRMVNQDGGLLGLSGETSDMRDLLASRNPAAAQAVALFCYQARKAVGAYAAALGGIDALVFTGGIGENLPEIRARICDGLEFLGVALDSQANQTGADLLSPAGRQPEIRMVRTDEEAMIAIHTADLLAGASNEEDSV